MVSFGFGQPPGAAPLQIDTASPLPVATEGQAYSHQLQASGGVGPYGNWRITAGALPDGLTLSPTGLISGTPTTAAAASPVTYAVDDSNPDTASKALELEVLAAGALQIDVSAVPGMSSGVFASHQLTTTGEVGDVMWDHFASDVPNPDFVGIDQTLGQIRGTPA